MYNFSTRREEIKKIKKKCKPKHGKNKAKSKMTEIKLSVSTTLNSRGLKSPVKRWQR